MTAHKHAEIGIAKLKNMDLVVFFKPKDSDEWLRINNANELPAFYDNYEYFLCHPIQADVCLHWLNGGEAGLYRGHQHWILIDSKDSYGAWSANSPFMNNEVSIRIKPRKETRWIGYHDYGHTTSMAYSSKDEAMSDTVNHEQWQFIEIEVEVKS